MIIDEDIIRKIADIIKKVNNKDLYVELSNISLEVYELQKSRVELEKENDKLKKYIKISKEILRHEEPVITKKDDEYLTYYCARCWDSDNKLIQVNCNDDGTFKCPQCKFVGIYDKNKDKEYENQLVQFPGVF